MRTLLYLTGQIDNPFFLNEISDFTNAFEKVIVVAYAEPVNSSYASIAQKYGFEYILLTKYPNLSEFLQTVKLFVKKEVKIEIQYAIHGKDPLKRIAYIAMYLVNAVKTQQSLRKFCDLDELYIYSFWLSRGAFSAALLKKEFNAKKVISRAHGYDVYEERSEVNYLPFRKYIIENVDEIHFISNNGYCYYKDMCLSRLYNYNGLFVTRLGTRNVGNKVRCFDEKNELVVVSCSAIISLKRLDLIIQIIKQINNSGLKVKWIHIGDGPERELIERQARDMIGNNYEFKGNLSNADVYSFYETNQVDFFINMSDSEGIPVSIMEAVSFGIPVIARNVGGNSEIVNENTGILIDETDENSIVTKCVRKVIDLYRDKNKYKMISKHAKEVWADYYDIEKNNRKLIDSLLS